MTISKKEIVYCFLLLVYSNIVNILFGLLQWYGIIMLRPMLYFEYLVICVLIAIRLPALIVWAVFVTLFLADLLFQFSFIYLFTPRDFIDSFRFFSFYSFSITQYFSLILILIFLFANYLVIKRFLVSTNRLRKFTIISTLSFFTVFLFIDVLNGNNSLHEERVILISKENVGGSLLNAWFRSDILTRPISPKRISQSITHKTFANDSSGNQMLIILESWGSFADVNEKAKFNKVLSDKASLSNWKIEFGETKFKGTTTAAELRELFSQIGNYQFFINKDSAKLFESIFDIKKRQGYYCVGAHSFTGKMFKREIWWKNVGLDTCYFMEDILERDKKSELSINYSNPFPSIDDEKTFSIINTPAIGQRKFGYLLTENAHLPYTEMNQNKSVLGAIDYKGKISAGANDQLKRIQEQLFYFINQADRKVWEKVIIVGDHMPPYSRALDRGFYSSTFVPYLILSQ